MSDRGRRPMPARITAVVIAAVMLLGGCADLAASTGGESDQIAGATHDQVQTIRLVAEAGLGDPDPTEPLRVVIDGAGSELAAAGEAALAMPTDLPDREPLLDLIDEALILADEVRAALDDGDHGALRDAMRRADELVAALTELSELL